MNALLVLAAVVAAAVLLTRDRDRLAVATPDLSALATEVHEVKVRVVELDQITRDKEASTHGVSYGVVEAITQPQDTYQ